jgi:uncharacterized protein (DUF305 family)
MVKFRSCARKLGFLIALLTSGFSAGVPALAHSDPAIEAMMKKMMSAPSMTALHHASGNAFEVAFMSEMIEHHKGGIEMSRMALKSARRKEVRAAANKVIEEQSKDIAQMTTWLNAWYKRTPDAKLRAQVKKESAPMMAAFKKACQKDCDTAFLMHMKAHHQMGIHMAEMATKNARHAELKQLAGKMIHSQSGEIKKFESLLHAEGHGTPSSSENHAGHH